MFMHAPWFPAVLSLHVSTAMLFGILLVGEFPDFGTCGFWRTVLPVVIVHLLVMVGLVFLSLNLQDLHKLPRVMLGLVGIIVMIEWRLSLFLIAVLGPKDE